jgi:hypothetical protein
MHSKILSPLSLIMIRESINFLNLKIAHSFSKGTRKSKCAGFFAFTSQVLNYIGIHNATITG